MADTYAYVFLSTQAHAGFRRVWMTGWDHASNTVLRRRSFDLYHLPRVDTKDADVQMRVLLLADCIGLRPEKTGRYQPQGRGSQAVYARRPRLG